MPWYLCDRIGDGSAGDLGQGILANPFRPAVADYGGGWATVVCLDPRGLCLVRAAHQAAFDSDPRIRRLSKALVASFVPDDGEPDGEDSAPLALKVTRRALLEQILGADDFGDHGSLTLADIPSPQRQRIANKLDARGIDMGAPPLTAAVADCIRVALPQIAARVEPRAQAPGGTFTDDFDGEVVQIDLSARTPSGGTAWTRVDGSANDARVNTNGGVAGAGSSAGTLYRCDDQGSADHYVEYVLFTNFNRASFFANRASAGNSWIGLQPRANPEMWKNVGGTLTQLGVGTLGSNTNQVYRLESVGNAHEAFVNSVSDIGPVNDSHNAAVTGQGFIARNDSANNIATSFEAGSLSTAHALVGDDLASSAPLLDSPQLGQVHALVGDDLASGAPLLDSPQLGQVHALIGDNLVAGAPALDAPQLGQGHNLVGNHLASGAPELDSPPLSSSGTEALIGDDLAAGAPILGSPPLGQVHALVGDDLVAGPPALDAPALSQVHNLVGDHLASDAPTLDAPQIVQVHVLVGDDLAAAPPLLDTPALTELLPLPAVRTSHMARYQARTTEIARYGLRSAFTGRFQTIHRLRARKGPP